MKTAVIGAANFIGSRIIESFHLGDGPAVVPVAADAAGVILAARFALDLRVADPTDEDALAAALAGCAAAVHVARGEPSERKRIATVFCRASARAGVRRLVYLSSAEVHGSDPAPDTNEKTRPDPASLDAAATAQALAERQFFAECRRAKLVGYALRPAIVFGPRSRFIADIAEELRDERAWLLGQGDAVCNTTYVDNLVAAVRLCLRAKVGAGQAYLLGDAETVTWREVYQSIARELDLSARRIQHVDSAPAETAPDRATAQQSRSKLRFTAASKMLGYSPLVTFAEAVRRSCAWWRFAQGDFFAAA